MCRLCKQVTKDQRLQNMSRPLDDKRECIWSEEFLTDLMGIVEDGFLRQLIKSQINTYHQNCNTYVERINKRIQQLGLKPIQP